MKRCSRLAVLALATAPVFVFSGCTRQTAAESAAAAAADASASAVDRVTAAPPARKTLQRYTTQPGRIEAFEQTPLYPKLAGFVDEVLVDIGDAVTKDDPLVKLWIPEMEDDVAQKEALVSQAEAELRQATAAIKACQAAVQTASALVHQADAGVTRAAGEHERWEAEHTRIKQLAANGSVTQKLVEEALSQLRAAEAARQEAAARVESAKAAHAEAEVNVEKAEADQGAAEAKLRVAQADLARAQTMLGYAEIKAPFDGIVTQRNVDTRHFVHPTNGASKPLVVVARNDQVRVFVDVPESEAALIDCGEKGDAATVRVQALADREFEAVVTRSSWSLDPRNRSLRVEIDIDNPEGVLRPGMYATAHILLDERADALTLPVTAVLREGLETFCCCVESGKIAHRKIALGLRSGADVEILSGLDAGDTVVLARGESLQPGQAVESHAPEGS
jgi:HlyD family secretion protein